MHPSTEAILKFFEYEHLSSERLRDISQQFHRLAHALVEDEDYGVPEGPELTVALRKLLESKDCAVRAAL